MLIVNALLWLGKITIDIHTTVATDQHILSVKNPWDAAQTLYHSLLHTVIQHTHMIFEGFNLVSLGPRYRMAFTIPAQLEHRTASASDKYFILEAMKTYRRLRYNFTHL